MKKLLVIVFLFALAGTAKAYTSSDTFTASGFSGSENGTYNYAGSNINSQPSFTNGTMILKWCDYNNTGIFAWGIETGSAVDCSTTPNVIDFGGSGTFDGTACNNWNSSYSSPQSGDDRLLQCPWFSNPSGAGVSGVLTLNGGASGTSTALFIYNGDVYPFIFFMAILCFFIAFWVTLKA